MGLTSDQQRIKTLLTETITLLCKNGLHFKSEFCIEGLLGITLDENNVFLINIKETVRVDTAVVKNQSSSKAAGTICVVSDVHSHKIDSSSSRPTVPQLQYHSVAAVDARRSSDAAESNERLPPSVSNTPVPLSQEIDADLSKRHAGRKRFHSASRSSSCSDFSTEPDRSAQEQEFVDNAAAGSDVSVAASTQRSEVKRQSLVPAPYKRSLVQSRCDIAEQDVSGNDDIIDFDDGTFGIINIKQESSDSMESESVNSQQSSQMQNYHCSTPRNSQLSSGTDQEFGQYLGAVPQTSSSSWNSACMSVTPYSALKSESSAYALNQATRMPRNAGRSALDSSQHVVYRCPECGKILTTSLGLSQHIKSIHQCLYSLLCPVCNKGFNSARDLRGHMSTKHNMQKDFRCLTCGREFSYKRSLNEHVCCG